MPTGSLSRKKRLWIPILAVVFLTADSWIPSLALQHGERISKFGEYRGYSEAVYDSWVRTSRYLTMRDGTKIAIDIVRPAKEGKVHQQPLPVIWTHNRYRRAHKQGGKVISAANSPLYAPLIRHGYIIANADVRGSGASFGSWQGIWAREETQDAYEINEWLASQPWCTGNVGMLGGSYLGVTQLMAASTQPPHLKAIFPVVALFDLYTVSYHGGVFYDDLHQHWSEFTKILDTEAVAAPVDEDKDESLLKAAIEEHKSSRPLIDIFSSLPYRDSVDEKTGAQPFYEWHPAGYIEEINQSGVPIYLFCGWFDSFTRDGFLMYRNFTTPRKMVMGNWPHNPHDPSVAREMLRVGIAEILRWFDYWLKGTDNGIMNDPPIHYHVMKAPGDNEWRSAEQWPLPEEKPTKYYFHKGPSGSVESVNDGILSLVPPYQESGKDDYLADYSTTTGTATRWDNAVGGDFNYPDMTENDKKGLTYTTAPLPEDFELTGFPVVHLWVSSTATDGDFFVYLEEVDAEGITHYVTEGTLRASHRALHEPYYDNLDLPFHRSHEEDLVGMVPGEPVELVIDLQPTSNVFNTGNRLRVTITCADKDNALTPEISPSPVVTVYRNTKQGSYILLPVFGPETEIGAEKQAGAAFSLFTILIIAVGVVVLVIVFTAYIRSRFRK